MTSDRFKEDMKAGMNAVNTTTVEKGPIEKKTDRVKLLPGKTLDANHNLQDPGSKALLFRNATESPLLSLPGEVRNMVYSYVMTAPMTIYFNRGKFDSSPPELPVFRRREGRHPNNNRVYLLPRVCRQMYMEISTLLFKSAFGVSRYSWGGFHTWVVVLASRLLPGQRSATSKFNVGQWDASCLVSMAEYFGSISELEQLTIISRWRIAGSDMEIFKQRYINSGKAKELRFVRGEFL